MPSEVWSDIYRRAAEDVGGIFDTSTGERDEEKSDLVQETLETELATQHGVDALLVLRVKQVRLDMVQMKMDFCGKTRTVSFPRPERPATWVRS